MVVFVVLHLLFISMQLLLVRLMQQLVSCGVLNECVLQIVIRLYSCTHYSWSQGHSRALVLVLSGSKRFTCILTCDPTIRGLSDPQCYIASSCLPEPLPIFYASLSALLHTLHWYRSQGQTQSLRQPPRAATYSISVYKCSTRAEEVTSSEVNFVSPSSYECISDVS